MSDESLDIRRKIVVTTVSATAVELDIEFAWGLGDELALIAGDFEWVDVDLGAVGTGHGWHLVDTTAHGEVGRIVRSADGSLDVSARVHVIVKRDEEEVVELEVSRVLVVVVSPSESVTVDFVLWRSIARVSTSRCFAQIGVIGRIGVIAFVDAAVSVVVSELTIAAEATHDGLTGAVVQLVNAIHSGGFSSAALMILSVYPAKRVAPSELHAKHVQWGPFFWTTSP